jgi:hypothetical protein
MDLTNFIIVLFLAAFWCFGFRVVIIRLIFDEFLGLDFFASWPDLSWQSKFIMKPLFACPFCMASIHGTFIYYFVLSSQYGYGWWFPFCIVLAGLNQFLSQFFQPEE